MLRVFSNLNRLEIYVDGSFVHDNKSLPLNLSLTHIRITLHELVLNLKYLLKAIPNLKRLRLRGSLGLNNVINQFELIAELLISLSPNLKRFDCELYCYDSDRHGNIKIIRPFHPLFNNVRYLVGPDENRCYTTDLDIYPDGNEYQRK